MEIGEGEKEGMKKAKKEKETVHSGKGKWNKVESGRGDGGKERKGRKKENERGGEAGRTGMTGERG